MSEASNATVTMAVDTKKYGIRIHKCLFRQLGEPRHIQLLVNPDDIVEKRMQSERSYEIYSRSFIRKLRELEPEIEDGGAYRLTGTMLPLFKIAVFSLKTLQRTDR